MVFIASSSIGTGFGSFGCPTSPDLSHGHEDRLGVRLAGGNVELSFHKATGGGTASANGVNLSATPVMVTTNASGQVLITFTTPATLPTVVVSDKLIASDAVKFGAVTAKDSYRY